MGVPSSPPPATLPSTRQKRSLAGDDEHPETCGRGEEKDPEAIDSDAEADVPEPQKTSLYKTKYSSELVLNAKDFLAEHSSTIGQGVWRVFLEFDGASAKARQQGRDLCTCEGLTEAEQLICKCSAIYCFVGAMEQADLCYGTRDTYLGVILAWRIRENRVWVRSAFVLIGRFRKIMARLHARFRTGGAVAVDKGRGNAVIQNLEFRNFKREATILWMMSNNGGRCNCITNMQYRDIGWRLFEHGGREITLTYRNGKNRNHAKDTFLSTERENANLIEPPKFLDEFLQEVDMKKHTDPLDRPFEGITTNSIGRLMRKFKYGVTTYGFRKHFAARIFAEGEDKLEVSRRIGHANTKQAEAFYLNQEMMDLVKEYQAKNRVDKFMYLPMQQRSKWTS